jgi:hypothetical protein
VTGRHRLSLQRLMLTDWIRRRCFTWNIRRPQSGVRRNELKIRRRGELPPERRIEPAFATLTAD